MVRWVSGSFSFLCIKVMNLITATSTNEVTPTCWHSLSLYEVIDVSDRNPRVDHARAVKEYSRWALSLLLG